MCLFEQYSMWNLRKTVNPTQVNFASERETSINAYAIRSAAKIT